MAGQKRGGASSASAAHENRVGGGKKREAVRLVQRGSANGGARRGEKTRTAIDSYRLHSSGKIKSVSK